MHKKFEDVHRPRAVSLFFSWRSIRRHPNERNKIKTYNRGVHPVAHKSRPDPGMCARMFMYLDVGGASLIRIDLGKGSRSLLRSSALSCRRHNPLSLFRYENFFCARIPFDFHVIAEFIDWQSVRTFVFRQSMTLATLREIFPRGVCVFERSGCERFSTTR